MFTKLEATSGVLSRTFKDLKPSIDGALQQLKVCTDLSAEEATEALSVIERSCEYGQCPCDNQRQFATHLKQDNFAQLFSKIWKGLCHFLEQSRWEQIGFTNLQLLVKICLSVSKYCPVEFGTDLATHGCISSLLQGLKQLKQYFNRGSDLVLLRGIVGDMFGILHNAIYKCTDNRDVYRRGRAVEDLSDYLKSDNDLVKIYSLLIMAYVINESESSIIATTEDGIAKLVHLLQEAVKVSEHKALAESTMVFSAFEILDCLNHLAINDDIKREIEKQGGVPVIVRMLEDDFTEEEQDVAARTLWNLSFIESIRNIDLQTAYDRK